MMFRRISRDYHCPECRGLEAYRIKRQGVVVKVLCKILNLRPHHCPSCNLYFLGPRQPGLVRIRKCGSPPRGPNGGTKPHPASLLH
jgi:hypothetical protein